MADILFRCKICSQRLAVEEELGEQKVRCPKCRIKTAIPKAEIAFDCPECSSEFLASVENAGETVSCPNCEHKIRVPAFEIIYKTKTCWENSEIEYDVDARTFPCPNCKSEVNVPYQDQIFNCQNCSCGIAAGNENTRKIFHPREVKHDMDSPDTGTEKKTVSQSEEDSPQETLTATNNEENVIHPKETTSIASHTTACPNCAKDIPHDAKFCSGCGVNLNKIDKSPDQTGSSQYCEYCGTPASAEAIICVACGRNMKTGEQLRTQMSPASPAPHESSSLLRCKECGGQISSSAKNCPKCGASKLKAVGVSPIARVVGLLALLMGILGIFISPDHLMSSLSVVFAIMGFLVLIAPSR